MYRTLTRSLSPIDCNLLPLSEGRPGSPELRGRPTRPTFLDHQTSCTKVVKSNGCETGVDELAAALAQAFEARTHQRRQTWRRSRRRFSRADGPAVEAAGIEPAQGPVRSLTR